MEDEEINPEYCDCNHNGEDHRWIVSYDDYTGYQIRYCYHCGQEA